MRARAAVMAMVLLWPGSASAEWQLRPFVGLTFGGGTTFVDLDGAAGDANPVFGASAVLLGEVLGVEADLGFAPGFFQSGPNSLVLKSGVTTLTGNLVVALPRRLAQYSLRPYFVGGGGLMRVNQETTTAGVLRVVRTLGAVDVGGGVTGSLNESVGVNWDLRYFRTAGGSSELRGVNFGAEHLSFWRATMGVAFRY